MGEALTVRNLSKRFGGLRAVQDLSFSVNEGQTVAVIGPNGAGKTTCFNLITGFVRPDTGSILVKGKEIAGLQPHKVCASGVARTFQVARPFGQMTVLANVMVGALLRDKDLTLARKRANEALAFAGISSQANRRACDLNTIDQRRLELARAMATEPEIVLLDEVMAGLNAAEIDQAISLVRQLSNRGLTIIIVEHVMRAVMAVAERIVVLDHGQKIAEGNPKEIAKDPRVIAAYLGSSHAAA
jgi:branched-chain amino acid transport system ATP-binding protein